MDDDRKKGMEDENIIKKDIPPISPKLLQGSILYLKTQNLQ